MNVACTLVTLFLYHQISSILVCTNDVRCEIINCKVTSSRKYVRTVAFPIRLTRPRKQAHRLRAHCLRAKRTFVTSRRTYPLAHMEMSHARDSKRSTYFCFFFPSSFNISPPSDFDEEATYYVCKCLITRVSFVRQIRRHPTNVRECAKNLHVARRAAFYSGRGQKRNQFRRYKCHGRTLFLSSANHSTPD